MMNGKGMLVICGNSVAELEQELKMLKMAVSTGAMMGCGGSTIGGVEQALKALTSAVGGTSPIVEDKCNCDCCCCGCNCDCEDEYDDEEIEYCPNCGDILDENGYCENCGYYWEDAEGDDDEPSPSALLTELSEMLEDRGELTPIIGGLLELLGGMM
jgi:hypothetical protein